jgi:predicted kinase
MRPTTVVLITGHPASGKTTLARFLAKELALPTLCKDDIKEILYDALGWSNKELWNQISAATWSLLYRQVDILLEAHIDCIVESNFDPRYANLRWQKLTQQFTLQLIQIRCECDPDILMMRYRERIQQGMRHPGHADQSDNPALHELVQRGPIGWIAVESERISVDTTHLAIEGYASIVKRIREISTAQK